MSDVTKKETLEILLKFNIDANKANAAADEISKKFKKLGQEVSAFNLRDMGEKLNQVGQALTGAGRGLSNTLMGSVNAYMAGAGKFDAKVQRWNQAQQEIQSAYARIGGVAIDKLTPYLEKAATLIDKLADFVEKNPWIVEAVAGTAALLTISGTITSTIAQAMMLAGSVEKIGGFLKIGGAAGGFGGTALAGGVYTAAAVGGGMLGRGLGNAINGAIGQDQQSWGDIGRTAQELSAMLSPLAAISAGFRAIGWEDQANSLWNFTKSMNGLGDASKDAGDKVKSGVSGLDSFAKDNLQIFLDYEKQKKDATEQYAQQVAQVEQDAAARRVEIISSFADRATQAEANYARQNVSAQRSYQASQAQAARDYYKQRAEAEAAYQTDVKRAAEDHKRALQQLEEDHNARVYDLVAARDALGLAKENDAYAKESGKLNEDYGVESKRKREDYAKQQAELQANFQTQRAQRAQEFAQQQAERAQQHAIEMQQLQKEKAQQLAQLDKATNDQLTRLRQGYDQQMKVIHSAFINSMNTLTKSTQGSTQAFQQAMAADLLRFQSWMRSNGFKGTVDGSAANGASMLGGQTFLVGERGPELFTAPRNGSIIPAGLTANLLNPRNGGSMGGRNMIVKIETPSLTMNEVINELDRRFGQFERGFADAWQTA